MDTQDFLRRILPVRGYKILATPRPAPYKGFKHHLATSHEEMADLAAELNAEGLTVYHACATYAEPQVLVPKRDFKTGEMVEKPAVRVASNAAYCKSFWLDLDVDSENPEKYPSQRAAAADLLAACDRAKLPVPMLVSSGYGVHAYWPLVEELPAAAWVKFASRLKALFNALKVKQDPSRTADCASVLRPVGMTNRKRPETPRTVKLIRDCPDYHAKDFLQAMLDAVKVFGVEVRDVTVAPRTALQAMFGGSLAIKTEYPPSSAHRVADKCAALGHVRTVLGNVEEPFWRAAMGVVKHTVEGDELAHEWSQGHPSYDKYETQDKLDRWQAGPSTCASLESFGKCEGCPMRGKIKSPIQLGVQLPESDTEVRVAPRAAPVVSEAAPVQTEDGKVVLPPLPESMRAEFSYRKGNLVRKIPGDDNTPDRLVVVCQEYIVPYVVIRPAGDAKQGNRAIIKAWRFTLGNRREEITLPYTAVATGGKDLVMVFGDIGIIVEPVGMHKYMKDWLSNIKREAGEDIHSMERMGWNGDTFVVGRTLFTPEGQGTAALASNLQMYQNAFTINGDLESWVSLIDRAYGRAGQEQYQFMLACGFGAPLLRFLGDYRGIMVSAVSYKSGQGKTTSQRAAMSIYGDASRLETAYGRQTQNALYERLGAMGNLPFMIDELSNVEGKELADMAYHVSQGVQKDRLTKSGELRAQREPWQTLVLTSGNRSIISALAAEGTQREPEMRRVLEFNFDPVSDLTKNEADAIFNELRHHYGVAGAVYLDYLARNQNTVQVAAQTMQGKLNDVLELAREERFWGAAITAAMTGLHIANKLGLVTFSVKSILPWVKGMLQDLRNNVRQTAGDEFDLLNRLMADLPFDLWVTANVGNRHHKPAHIIREPKRGVVAGRLVVETNTLTLRPEYVRQWCDKHRADHNQLRALLIKHGCFLDVRSMPRDLMTGIPNVNPLKGRFWELDMTKLEQLSPITIPAVEDEGLSDNVVRLRPADVS